MRNVTFLLTLIFCLATASLSAQSVTGQNPLMLINRNNGTLPSGLKAPVLDTDTLGDLRFQGWVTDGYYYPGSIIRTHLAGAVEDGHFPADMIFMTGQPWPTLRMTIRHNGNVGINTYTPQQLLTLSHADEPVFRFDRAATDSLDFELYTGQHGTLFFRGGADEVGNNLTDFMVLTAQGRLGLGTTTPSQLFTLSDETEPVFRFEQSDPGIHDFEVFTAGNGSLFFRGGADGTGSELTNRMVLTGNGNLGLGTDTPDQQLTLSSATEPTFRFEQSSAGIADLELNLNGDGDLYFRGGADGTGGALSNLMVLKSNGKLAIGTTQTPDDVGGNDISNYTLYAQGGILTEEVRVRTGWADYVFQEDYRLLSLEEVDAHINTYGYLPNTPAATVVETQGLSLGDCAVSQQEKIEEIFLHLIEMNKKLKELRAENETLKSEVKKLRQ